MLVNMLRFKFLTKYHGRNKMRIMRNQKSLSNLILLAIEKTIDGYVALDDFVHHPMFIERNLRQSELSREIKRLRERGLIDFVSDEKLAYRLTDKGKQKAVWESVIMDDGKWDGRWRVVIFDIPEKRREARNLFRSSLKKWGFKAWQQSVWATKKNCTKALRKFVNDVGIEDWVLILESDNVGRKM